MFFFTYLTREINLIIIDKVPSTEFSLRKINAECFYTTKCIFSLFSFLIKSDFWRFKKKDQNEIQTKVMAMIIFHQKETMGNIFG